MIIMNVKADNLFAFKNFHINMSYPKKIVDSTIQGEYLVGKPNFRYKKVNIIMGGNATGKTSLGKLLITFANYFRDGSYARFLRLVDDAEKIATLQVDFVTGEEKLHRFEMKIVPCEKGQDAEEEVDIKIFFCNIGSKDSYEKCVEKFNSHDCVETTFDKVNTNGWYFAYPQDGNKNKTYYSIEDDEKYLKILQQTLQTLDPSIQEVVKLAEVQHAYAIKYTNGSVIIKDGKIADGERLSSGTKAGLDISCIIASLVCDKHDLYYCDELFSYINSDIEKACLSIMIEKLKENKQLFFTTHNTDILDMQLPKHTFTFLKKDITDVEMPIKCIYAGNYLKRNTDSLKHAVENDLFCTAPDLEKLYEIAEL